MFKHNFKEKFMQLTEWEMRDLIFRTIQEKAKTVDFYTQLYNSAQDTFTKRILETMIKNNQDDLELYRNLYIENYDEIPDFTFTLPAYYSYQGAVLSAMENVINTIDIAPRFLATGEGQLATDLFRATLILDIENLSKLGIIYNYLYPSTQS